MLTGEPVSDRPGSVCPVLAAFLRAYNDHLTHSLRQSLYPWASDAAGTHDVRVREMTYRASAIVNLTQRIHPRSPPWWWDRCFGAHGRVVTAGVRCARAVRRDPALHAEVDAGLRRIYGLQCPEAIEPSGGDYLTRTWETMPLATCGGPPARSATKQKNA